MGEVAQQEGTQQGRIQQERRPIPGLKVGLEIHQQLGQPGDATGDRKLFCGCTAEIVERQPDITLTRRLRAPAGETGEVDIAAAAEQAKGKRYTYHAFHDATCLVETDEEPPHPVNPEAILTAVMVAKAFGSTILPHVQFMRKTVVDGSAVSGFQRTGLLALGGAVPGIEPKVRIQTLCVEEDAAKILSRAADGDVYNLSRLGIPLLEIATEPDITSPQQAQEVAAQIGMVLRSTKRVKRGLGTIRQDLNISIPGGTRIEIKGCQDLRLIPTYIEYEALRQQSLLRVKEVLAARTDKRHLATLSSTDIVDATAVFSDSKTSFIKSALDKGDRALGIRVPGFAGILGMELCPGTRVGSELADIARARGFGGLLHSDEEMARYGAAEHASMLKEIFSLGEKDGFIIIIGKSDRVAPLLDDLLIPRIVRFLDGVPPEVRRANPDGTTSFQRPMPGAARMYPETDIPIVEVRAADVPAPTLLTDHIAALRQRTGISEDAARQVVREGLPLEEWLERYPSVDPTFLANAMLTFGKEISARYKKEVDHIALLEPLLEDVERKKLPKNAVFEILVGIAEGRLAPGNIDYARYAQLPDGELRAIVREEIKKGAQLPVNGIMGNVMARVRGKAEGKRVLQMIEEEKTPEEKKR